MPNLRSSVLTVLIALAAGAAPAEAKADLAGELAALKSEVADLEKRTQANDDYIAIANLQRIYGYYVDKAEWDQVADLFSEDATLEIAGRGVFVGQDRIRTYMHNLMPGEHRGKSGIQSGQLMNHMQLQPVIHVAPEGGAAKARWRAFIQVGELGKTAMWGEGTYENEYVKEGGVWKISKLHFYTTYYIDFYKGWDKGGVPLFGQIEGLAPDRPPSETYEAYPGVYVPPYHYKNPVSGRE